RAQYVCYAVPDEPKPRAGSALRLLKSHPSVHITTVCSLTTVDSEVRMASRSFSLQILILILLCHIMGLFVNSAPEVSKYASARYRSDLPPSKGAHSSNR